MTDQFHSGKCLPDCMMPDGGECCRGYVALYDAYWNLVRASPLRVIGAINLVEEAACLIWSELCPGMVMGDADLPHYEAAAKAVLALTAEEIPMLADITHIISNGWKAGKGPDVVAAEILREFDAAHS